MKYPLHIYVVGGGVVGIMTAFELANAHSDSKWTIEHPQEPKVIITVIDKEPDVGLRDSLGNAGHSSPDGSAIVGLGNLKEYLRKLRTPVEQGGTAAPSMFDLTSDGSIPTIEYPLSGSDNAEKYNLPDYRNERDTDFIKAQIDYVIHRGEQGIKEDAKVKMYVGYAITEYWDILLSRHPEMYFSIGCNTGSGRGWDSRQAAIIALDTRSEGEALANELAAELGDIPPDYADGIPEAVSRRILRPDMFKGDRKGPGSNFAEILVNQNIQDLLARYVSSKGSEKAQYARYIMRQLISYSSTASEGRSEDLILQKQDIKDAILKYANGNRDQAAQASEYIIERLISYLSAQNTDQNQPVFLDTGKEIPDDLPVEISRLAKYIGAPYAGKYLSNHPEAVLLEQAGGSVNPELLVKELKRRLEHMSLSGIQFSFKQAEVTGAEWDGDRLQRLKIQTPGAETTEYVGDAQSQFVITTGANHAIAQTLGIPDKIPDSRGYGGGSISMELPPELVSKFAGTKPLIFYTKSGSPVMSVMKKPTGEFVLRLGGLYVFVGEQTPTMDMPEMQHIIKVHMKLAAQIVPELMQAILGGKDILGDGTDITYDDMMKVGAWVGSRQMACDTNLSVGMVGENVAVGVDTGSVGVVASPLIASILVQLLDGVPREEVKLYSYRGDYAVNWVEETNLGGYKDRLLQMIDPARFSAPSSSSPARQKGLSSEEPAAVPPTEALNDFIVRLAAPVRESFLNFIVSQATPKTSGTPDVGADSKAPNRQPRNR